MNNISMPKITKRRIVYGLMILISLYLIITYRIVLSDILKPFVIASVISYLLNPIVLKLERKGIKRIIGVFIVFIAFIAIIMLLGFILIPTLIKDIGKLIENIPQYSSNLQHLLDNFQEGKLYNNLPQALKNIIDDNIFVLQGIILELLQNFGDSIIAVVSELFDIILIPIIIFYMLKDANYFKNQFILLVPKSKRQRGLLLFRDIDNAFGKFIRGQIIVATFVFLMTTILLLIIKVKYSLVLGLFAGIANVVPYFGPIIGIIPTVIFAFFDSPTKALYAAGAFLLVQQVESGILSPKILGESVGIHPVYVILSLLIGGKLFGVIGLIAAVPGLVAIKLTLRHLLRRA